MVGRIDITLKIQNFTFGNYENSHGYVSYDNLFLNIKLPIIKIKIRVDFCSFSNNHLTKTLEVKFST